MNTGFTERGRSGYIGSENPLPSHVLHDTTLRGEQKTKSHPRSVFVSIPLDPLRRRMGSGLALIGP
ncbi:unnamed protein product [Penicillium salamii]|nr:unnamed protein product [Penicillium salamii]CAG8409674.1 unnamed protein product [Penicillium salamii]